jgi:hypothetical protein
MGKNQDLGSGINIPDLQHCLLGFFVKILKKTDLFIEEIAFVEKLSKNLMGLFL